MGGVFSQSVAAYSETDLRDVTYSLGLNPACWNDDWTHADVVSDVEALLGALRPKPTKAQHRSVMAAVKRRDILEVRAAGEAAGLDHDALCKIEKRALLEKISRVVDAGIFRPTSMKLLELRLRGHLGGDCMVESAHEAWSRVKRRIRIHAPISGQPGAEIAPPVTKISPARWVALEKKLGVWCNISLWVTSTRLLFLTDVDCVMRCATARPCAARSLPPASAPEGELSLDVNGSVIAKHITADNLNEHFTLVIPCDFCGSVWPSRLHCALHQKHCIKNAGSPSFCHEATVGNTEAFRQRCAYCAAGFMDKSQWQVHQTHCLMNLTRAFSDPPSDLNMCQHCGLTFKTRRGCGSHKGHCPKNPVAPKPFDEHIVLAADALGLHNSTPQDDYPRERRRADVVHAMWDSRVIQAWCSVDWEESSREILCFLLWRNIDFAVKHGWVSDAALQHFLQHFGAPPEYGRDAQWDFVVDALFKAAPAVLERKLDDFFDV